MPFGAGCGGGWPCPRREPAPCSGPGRAPSCPGTGQEVVACVLLVSLLGDGGRGLPPGTRREQQSSLAGSTRPSGRAPGSSAGLSARGLPGGGRRGCRLLSRWGLPWARRAGHGVWRAGRSDTGPHTGARVPAGPRVGAGQRAGSNSRVPGSSQRGRRAWAGGRGPRTAGSSQRGPYVSGPPGGRLPGSVTAPPEGAGTPSRACTCPTRPGGCMVSARSRHLSP